MNKLRYNMFLMTIFLVLALNAMNVVPVFADDGTPSSESPAEITPPMENESAITAALPVMNDSEVTGVPLVDNATAPQLELLQQLPESIAVIITNSNGDVVPLATEEAAEIVATHDPLWCPAGVAPNPNNQACTGNADSLWDLINFPGFYGQSYTSGVIWIQSGYDQSGFDANYWASTWGDTLIGNGYWSGSENYNITLQGGWNGTYGSTTLNAVDPYSYFDTKIEISGWVGNVTLNNIVIDTDPLWSYSPANNDYGLYIQTLGSVTLNYVTVANNENTNAGGYVRGGAYLNNTGTVTGTLTVNNSNFNSNEGGGLRINSAGIVNTNNLVALGNGGTGTYIDNSWASTAKPVTMKGLKQFVGNGGSGLVIHSNGVVTLSNLVATDNGINGVYIDNTWGMLLSTPVYMNVAISGSNLFSNNTNNGLQVYSFGAISISNVTALNNGGDGAYLDNCIEDSGGVGSGDCFSKAAKPITVSGTNIFNNNGFGSDNGNGCFYGGLEFGLEICSAGGAIVLSNITASYNSGGGGGVFADNRLANFSGQKIAGAWTLTGYGVFNANSNPIAWGLEGWTYGPMNLNNITANDNGWEGAYLRALNAFSLNGYGVFNNNGGDGLHLQTSTTTTLNNITANGNISGNGINVTAWRLGDLLFASVTFKGVNTFNENGLDGLHVETDGAISLNNVTAIGNGADGVDLCNYFNVGSGYLCNNPANVTASLPYTPDGNGSSAGKGITLTGINTFNDNWLNGLLVNSNGAILINNLTADYNGQSNASGSGAVLDNYQGGITITPRPVTLIGPVNVNYNYYRGLEIYSLGTISLGNITATHNAFGTGVHLDNQWNSTKQSNVTITGSNNQFNNNGENGLKIYSYGAISISNVTANWNDSQGAFLSNFGGYYVKPITVSGTNNFNWNYYNGLYITSDGAITLIRVTANFNDTDWGDSYDGYGIYASTFGAVTLTCGFAYGNHGYGMYLNSASNVTTIKGWYSWANGVDYYFSLPNIRNINCLLP